MSATIYFTTPDGTRYRVLDSAWHEGKRVIANPPAAWATTRVSRRKEEHRRLFRLTSAQLWSAEYLPTLPPHQGATDPRKYENSLTSFGRRSSSLRRRARHAYFAGDPSPRIRGARMTPIGSKMISLKKSQGRALHSCEHLPARF